MSKLFIRHAFSKANDRTLYGTPAFGSRSAELQPEGWEQAYNLGNILRNEHGIDTSTEKVGVSTLTRTQQTALGAGFRKLIVHSFLDEEKGGMSDEETRWALDHRQSPEATVKAARYIIDNPPEEQVIITHAYIIATICSELGLYAEKKFTPRFCEIREIPI